MNRLVSIELRKIRTTPALWITTAITVTLTLASVVANIELAGTDGAPALGSPDNVDKVLAVSALSSMVAMAIGIIIIGGEYRHRTILNTYLGEPRRGRVLVAKLATAGGLGLVLGAATFGLAVAVATPMYAAHGVDQLLVDIPRLWVGAAVATACYGLLGVAIGSLTRNTVAAIIGAVVWVQLVEVGILQNAAPSLAKWLPTGAGVALTSGGGDAADLLPPGIAAMVLVGWAGALAAVATRRTISKELP